VHDGREALKLEQEERTITRLIKALLATLINAPKKVFSPVTPKDASCLSNPPAPGPI